MSVDTRYPKSIVAYSSEVAHRAVPIRQSFQLLITHSADNGNSLEKLRHSRSDAYSAEQVLLNRQQTSSGGAYLDCYPDNLGQKSSTCPTNHHTPHLTQKGRQMRISASRGQRVAISLSEGTNGLGSCVAQHSMTTRYKNSVDTALFK